VWQEGTWGMIDALVQLNGVPTLQSYFNGVILSFRRLPA
jgi:hypothetical protein